MDDKLLSKAYALTAIAILFVLTTLVVVGAFIGKWLTTLIIH